MRHGKNARARWAMSLLAVCGEGRARTMSQVAVPVCETDPLIGRAWGEAGRYRLETLLGRGNRASVYLAVDTATAQPVGVRILDPELCANAALVERFLASVAA